MLIPGLSRVENDRSGMCFEVHSITVESSFMTERASDSTIEALCLPHHSNSMVNVVTAVCRETNVEIVGFNNRVCRKSICIRRSGIPLFSLCYSFSAEQGGGEPCSQSEGPQSGEKKAWTLSKVHLAKD